MKTLSVPGAEPSLPNGGTELGLHCDTTLSRRSFLVQSATLGALGLLWGRRGEAQDRDDTGGVYSALSLEEKGKISNYTRMIGGLQGADPTLSVTLHPEGALDLQPEQQKLFAGGGSFEFTPGYLYHGRGDLKKVLLNGGLPKQSHLTRVPQTWALQPFVDGETDPAIYALDALEFNRWRNEGRAGMYLVPRKMIDSEFYDAEPYPWLSDSFPLEKILKIIISEATHKKLSLLVEQWEEKPSALSEEDQKVAQRFKELKDADKVNYFGTGKEDQTPVERFMELRTDLDIHLHLLGMAASRMPRFRQRTKNSTGEHEVSPKPMSSSEALKSLKTVLEDWQKTIEDKDREKEASEREKGRKEMAEFWKFLGIGTGVTAGAGGFLYWTVSEFRKALHLAEQEQSSHAKGRDTKKRTNKK